MERQSICRLTCQRTVDWHVKQQLTGVSAITLTNCQWYVSDRSTKWQPTIDQETVTADYHSSLLQSRPRLNKISNRYVDHQSTEMSIDTSVDTPYKKHNPLVLLSVKQVNTCRYLHLHISPVFEQHIMDLHPQQAFLPANTMQHFHHPLLLTCALQK